MTTALRLPRGPHSTRWFKVPELSASVRVFADGTILARSIQKDGRPEPAAFAVEVQSGTFAAGDAAVLAAIEGALRRREEHHRPQDSRGE